MSSSVIFGPFVFERYLLNPESVQKIIRLDYAVIRWLTCVCLGTCLCSSFCFHLENLEGKIRKKNSKSFGINFSVTHKPIF